MQRREERADAAAAGEEIDDAPLVFDPDSDDVNFSREAYRYWRTHTHVPCYLLLIINVLVESSFMSVVLPLFYFLWGGLVRPFPSVLFWKALTIYSMATISTSW